MHRQRHGNSIQVGKLAFNRRKAPEACLRFVSDGHFLEVFVVCCVGAAPGM